MFDTGLTVKEKLDASHSWGHKVKSYHDCVHMHRPYKTPLGKWAFSVDIITLKISIYPQNPNIIMHILYAVIHTVFEMLRWGNLFYNREFLELVIVSFILEALMSNSGVIL